MKLEDAIKKFIEIKKGVYTRVVYSTELPIKAEYKNNVKIIKYSFTTGRFGINYGNLNSVKNKNNTNKKIVNKKDNKVWILKNIIEYNKNTGKFYLNVFSSPNKSKNIYLYYKDGSLVGTFSDLSSLDCYAIPSYINKKCSSKELFKVNLENVHFVG